MQRKTHRENAMGRGRQRSGNTSISQWILKIVRNYQKLGERPRIDYLSETSEGTNPADTLTSDFQPPEL